MGFKKGWKAYKAQQRKTKSKRKSSPKPKSKGSTRRSTRSSNPGGGARTQKMGALFKKLKAIFNLSSGAQGAYVNSGSLDGALRNALARYTGVMLYDTGLTKFDTDFAKDNWAGMASEIGVQWIDSKTRHFGNMSRGKLLDIVEEAVPIIMAHEDAKGAPDYMTQAARNYHKYTQGYDMLDGSFGTWNFDRMKPYATVKGVRIVANKLGIIPWINKRLPKGINL